MIHISISLKQLPITNDQLLMRFCSNSKQCQLNTRTWSFKRCPSIMSYYWGIRLDMANQFPKTDKHNTYVLPVVPATISVSLLRCSLTQHHIETRILLLSTSPRVFHKCPGTFGAAWHWRHALVELHQGHQASRSIWTLCWTTAGEYFPCQSLKCWDKVYRSIV